MNPTQPSVPSPREFARILTVHAKRWLVPAAVVAALVAVYAVLRPDTWEASQALIVRNKAANNQQGPGKFGHVDEMKTVQETILELAKSRGVLAAALVEVGPPAGHNGKAPWPGERDVADLREALRIKPPKGAEFGKTEVFYVKVRSKDRARAVALATAMVDELTERFQKLLDDRAGSMIGELEKAVALAAADLKQSTRQLAELERAVGSDLSELRILHESPAGNSDLRQKVVELENELRQAETDRHAKAELLGLLKSVPANGHRLQALPSRLLESHATLRQLSEGLGRARLTTSNLLGRMSKEHPTVRAAEAAEAEILRDLSSELANAISIAEVELGLADARVELLTGQLGDVRSRFDRLAGLRAEYANLVAQTQNRTQLLESARRTLADARASQAAARTASRIARIDRPDTGTRPVGPSRAVLVAFGLVGGLLAGWGVLFVTIPSPGRIDPAGAPPEARAQCVRPASPEENAPSDATQPSTVAEGSLSLKQALSKISCGVPTWN